MPFISFPLSLSCRISHERREKRFFFKKGVLVLESESEFSPSLHENTSPLSTIDLPYLENFTMCHYHGVGDPQLF